MVVLSVPNMKQYICGFPPQKFDTENAVPFKKRNKT